MKVHTSNSDANVGAIHELPLQETLPAGWEKVPFVSAVKILSDDGKRIKQSNYLQQGKIPVIDQGQDSIGGYIDDEVMAFKGDLPVIIFGDHTRNNMKKTKRYDTSHLTESQFEPGSRGRVLRNLLHITRKREMDVIEAERYALVQTKLMGMLQAGLRGLDFTDIQGKKRKEYFAAVQAGMGQDYEPMKKVFRSVVSRTRQKQVQR